MKDGNNVVDKMTSLQELFKSTKDFVEKSPELASVMAFIQEQGENEFISIAYEAAAMALALQDLEKGTTLDTWNDFLDNYGSQHAVQIYIGLGLRIKTIGSNAMDSRITPFACMAYLGWLWIL